MSREILTGAAWMIFVRVCDRLLGLVSTLILARLLVPADFGLIAMAMSVIALIELAGAFSFEIALIRQTNPAREHYDTAWTLNLAFALLCSALIAGVAPLAARFYEEPRLTLLMIVLAAGWLAQGFENIGIVNFRRRMDFASEFKFMFSKRLVGFVVTISLAIALQSYWALALGQSAMRATGLVLSYYMEGYRPRLSLAARRDLFSFSGWLLVTNIMSFGLARLPHFVIGRLEGPAALGKYTIAAEFARLPSTELSAPINRAVLPGLSRVRENNDELRALFIQVMSTTFALTLPAAIGLAMTSALVIQTVLGSQWRDASPLLAILAVAGAVEVVASNNGIAYLVLGRTRLVAGMNATKLVVLIAAASILVPSHGILGMALAELVSAALVVILSTAVLIRSLSLSIAQLWAATWRTMVSTMAMAVALLWIAGPPLHADPTDPAWLLPASIILGAIVHLASMLTLWLLSGRPPGVEAAALRYATQLLTNIRLRRA